LEASGDILLKKASSHRLLILITIALVVLVVMTTALVVLVVLPRNVEDNYGLTVIDNENWGPTLDNSSLSIPAGEDQTTTLSVHIPENAIGCTRDNITVTATSVENENGSDNASAIAHLGNVCAVEVSISLPYQEGKNGDNLYYIVTVHNTGNITDSFLLTHIPDGWPDITIVPDQVGPIPPFGTGNATLIVNIPENEPSCTEKEIVVIAESEFCGATDNASARAHVKGVCIPTIARITGN